MKTEDLLAKASPRPWNTSDQDPNVNDADGQPIVSKDDLYSTPDTRLIVRAVNEYEALLAVERTSRGLRTLSGGDLAELLNEQDAALAKLDEIRKGQA